jgi:hypothetical protein
MNGLEEHSSSWALFLGFSVGMASLQQFEQPAFLVEGHVPRPKRRSLSVADDLGDGGSPGTVAFDRDHLNAFTATRIIGGAQARGIPHPSFGDE